MTTGAVLLSKVMLLCVANHDFALKMMNVCVANHDFALKMMNFQARLTAASSPGWACPTLVRQDLNRI